MVNYTRNPPTAQLTRAVAIQSVDVTNQGATGINSNGTYYIDTSYYVGAVSVTPTVGDQWMIEQINGQWRLNHRLPFNDPNQTITATQGQHIVGSGQGPVELNAGPTSTINANSPLAVASYTTATLPDPTSVPAGTHVYDSTLSKPVWSNGTTWTDATGTPI